LIDRYWKQYRLSWILLAVSIGVLTWLIIDFADPKTVPADDFVEYWAAGRLNVSNGNPYDPTEIKTLQTKVGLPDEYIIMMWNPPWTLTFVMPFSLLDYPVSRTLWLLLNLFLVFFAADWMWLHYGGPKKYRWLAWLLAFTFAPTLFLLDTGQIGAFILVGVIGFLHFTNRRQWCLAGSCLILIAIKPHLLYLFWIALILWMIDKSNWMVAICGTITGLIATAIPFIINPDVISQYLYTTLNQPPLYWKTPTLGSVLRLLFGIDIYWLQFLPSVLGALWFFFYWFRHRYKWNWSEQIPIILIISVVTASFGWEFDQIVLLPVMIQIGVWVFQSDQRVLTSIAIIIHLLITSFAIVITFLPISNFGYIWMAPTFALIYLCLRVWSNDGLTSCIDPNFKKALNQINHRRSSYEENRPLNKGKV
jgi:hypothetical protein